MKQTTKAKAKKPAAVKPDHDERDPLACREYAPTLVEQRATLLPFNDVICGGSAGPQPKAKTTIPTKSHSSGSKSGPNSSNRSYSSR
jgi:hypothetical protein